MSLINRNVFWLLKPLIYNAKGSWVIRGVVLVVPSGGKVIVEFIGDWFLILPPRGMNSCKNYQEKDETSCVLSQGMAKVFKKNSPFLYSFDSLNSFYENSTSNYLFTPNLTDYRCPYIVVSFPPKSVSFFILLVFFRTK